MNQYFHKNIVVLGAFICGLSSFLVAQKALDQQDYKTIVTTVLHEVQAEIDESVKGVVALINRSLTKIENYTPAHATSLVNDFDQVVSGFRAQMRVVKTTAIAHYERMVKQNMGTSIIDQLSAQDYAFIQGVDMMVGDAIVKVQALVLDITSQNLQNKLSKDLTLGFYESALQAERAYERQKSLNESELNRDWWDKIHAAGEDFLKDFYKNLKKELSTQTTEIISELNDDLVKDIGQSLGGLAGQIGEQVQKLTPELSAQLKSLSQSLQSKSLGYLESDHSSLAIVALKKAIRMNNPTSKPQNAVNVDISTDLCVEEKQYVQKRIAKIQPVLQKHFGVTAPVRIAFCCSGGGNRAMVGTLGMLMAAAKHNFLQASMYCVGLSGSTWTIAPFVYMYLQRAIPTSSYEAALSAMRQNFETTLNDSNMVEVKSGIYAPPLLDKPMRTELSKSISILFGYDQHISLVDVWGFLIGNYALEPLKQQKVNATWSQIKKLVQRADVPLPLCAAAFDPKYQKGIAEVISGASYEWLETGPFQAGSSVLGYIPIEYLGSVFKQGTLQADLTMREYPLYYYLGFYGSAFSVSLNDVVGKGIKDQEIPVFGRKIKVPVQSWVSEVIDKGFSASGRSKRFDKALAVVPNFSEGVATSVLKHSAELSLFDAGISFNDPLPLLFERPERGVDIVIMYDSNPKDLDSLKSADAYFKRKNIAMPKMGKVKVQDLVNNKVLVFNDPRDQDTYEASMPTLIYFPTKVDSSKPPFITLNFKYTKNDIATLIGEVNDSFESQVDNLKEIVKQVASSRYDAQGRALYAKTPTVVSASAIHVQPAV